MLLDVRNDDCGNIFGLNSQGVGTVGTAHPSPVNTVRQVLPSQLGNTDPSRHFVRSVDFIEAEAVQNMESEVIRDAVGGRVAALYVLLSTLLTLAGLGAGVFFVFVR